MPSNPKQAILTVHDDEKADLFSLHMSALTAKARCQWWSHIPHKFWFKKYLFIIVYIVWTSDNSDTTLALSPMMSDWPYNVNDQANFLKLHQSYCA